MLGKLTHIIRSLFFIACLLLGLLFPLISFRIGLISPIFPALEIIFVYYFSTNQHLRIWQIFLIGIFFDQLYSMPIGTNSLVFLLANLLLKFVNRRFLLKAYFINFIIFCGYCLFIFYSRYLILSSKTLYLDSFMPLFFQYLTTVFSYPLVRIPLDKSIEYLNKHAK